MKMFWHYVQNRNDPCSIGDGIYVFFSLHVLAEKRLEEMAAVKDSPLFKRHKKGKPKDRQDPDWPNHNTA